MVDMPSCLPWAWLPTGVHSQSPLNWARPGGHVAGGSRWEGSFPPFCGWRCATCTGDPRTQQGGTRETPGHLGEHGHQPPLTTPGRQIHRHLNPLESCLGNAAANQHRWRPRCPSHLSGDSGLFSWGQNGVWGSGVCRGRATVQEEWVRKGGGQVGCLSQVSPNSHGLSLLLYLCGCGW